MVELTELYMHWYAGRSKVEVARSLGVDPKTVRRYVAAAEAAGLSPGGEPIDEAGWRKLIRGWFPALVDARLRQPSWTGIAAFHDLIGELVEVVPVSVIHQRLRDEHGLEASVASLRRYVRAHFEHRRAAADVVVWGPAPEPGALGQVDYGYMGLWLDPASGHNRKVWAFSMVLPCSKHLFVYPVLRMDQQAWNDAHVAAFAFFDGCPRRLTPDNLRAGVISPSLYDPQLNRAYAELAAFYRVLIDPARAFKPKDKPHVESLQRYIRSSWFTGRCWVSVADMRADAARWSADVAGARTPRALEGRTPLDVFGAVEHEALLPLPATTFELARWSRPKVAPDAHVRVGNTLYSVPWRHIGTRLDARATATKVQLFLDGELIKTHPFQERGRRTDWVDLPEQRTGFYMRTPAWCQAQAATIGAACDALVGELLAVNVLFRLRQAQGVIRLVERYPAQRVDAACRRALDVGDGSYKTVKGILAAGTENDAVQLALPGIPVGAWLRGPGAFTDKHDHVNGDHVNGDHEDSGGSAVAGPDVEASGPEVRS